MVAFRWPTMVGQTMDWGCRLKPFLDPLGWKSEQYCTDQPLVPAPRCHHLRRGTLRCA